MLIFFLNVMSFSVFGDRQLGKYQPYCQAKYRAIPQKDGFKFRKLIVIHRHGDRTPLRTYGVLNDECVSCKSSKTKNTKDLFSSGDCSLIKCEDGLLTKKGYSQMIHLGQFIKKNYFHDKKIEFGDISMRATNVKRTQASLSGLVTGLFNKKDVNKILPRSTEEDEEIENAMDADDEKEVIDDDRDSIYFGESFHLKVPNLKEDTLIGTKSCPRFTHILTLTSKRGFENLITQRDLQNITDNYLYSMCRDMELDCNRVPCDESQSISLIEGSFKTWTYQSILLNTHEEVMKFVFGKFAGDLLDSLRNNRLIDVFSAHDNSLSYILAGLKTQVIERPPLASAIFIEVWSYNSVKYIRIIFNEYVCLTDLDESTNIPYEKVVKYLESVHVDDKYLAESCKLL